MQRNARYTGGSGTGVDLVIPLTDGQLKPLHCDPGTLVPTEIAGIAVEPLFIEGLLEQVGTWTPATVKETAAERTERERQEDLLDEQQAAAAAAAAELLGAAELADKTALEAQQSAETYRAEAAAAASAAIARVKAEQQLAQAQQQLADLNAGDNAEQPADTGEKEGSS